MSAAFSGSEKAFDAVRLARRYLLKAIFELDDADYQCAALSDLHDGTTALLSEWSGRGRPDPDALPQWAIAATVEWRRQRDRARPLWRART